MSDAWAALERLKSEASWQLEQDPHDQMARDVLAAICLAQDARAYALEVAEPLAKALEAYTMTFMHGRSAAGPWEAHVTKEMHEQARAALAEYERQKEETDRCDAYGPSR